MDDAGHDGTGPGHGRAKRDRERATDGGASAVEHTEDPLERMTDGVVTLDDEWTVTYLNGAAAAALGTDAERAVGRPFAEVAPGDGTVFWRAAEAATTAGEAVTVEDHHDLLDAWMEVRAYPDEDGVSLFFRDVTDRRRAREELAASESALRELHATVSDTELDAAEKLERILAVGRERLGVDVGMLTRVEGDTWRVEAVAGEHPGVDPGVTLPLSETVCREVVGSEGVLGVTEVDERWAAGAREVGVACYLGTELHLDGEPYGTVCFADRSPREREFTESETALVEVLADWVRYVLDLEHEQAFVESILDSLPDPLYAFDEEARLVRWNDRVAAVTGYDDDELAGMSADEFIAEPDRERALRAVERVNDGERVSFEADLETRAGDYLPYELSGAPITEGSEVVGATGVARDVSDQRAQREMLSGLLEATGQLMQARDREEVAEVAATAAQSVLGFDINLVRLYDREAGTLVPAARTEKMALEMGERPVYEVGEGNPGEVFASGEPRVVNDVTDGDVVGRGGIRSIMYHPIGVHGTISVGATEPGAFDETDQQVLALLATSAAAACTRAKREQEVREAQQHTETVLDRVNGLVENTVEVLVQAVTREELSEGVVSELAAADPYSFAWLGRPDVASETLSPSTWAGRGDVPAGDLEFDLNGDGPVARAYRTGEAQVVQDIAASVGDVPCASAVLGEDVRASIVVPLVYKETTYGVLAVFADEAGAFDEREQVVLTAIGRAVANAINAIERGRIMDATEIIELEFTVDDADLLFCRLSRGADCRVEAAGTDYRPDGSIRLYVTAESADGERLAALAREDSDVTAVKLITDHEDGCLLELTVEDSLLATLTEFGAVPREVVGEDGTTRFTVELPYEGEAREVFDLVERRYPSTDLVGYHERERPVETRQEFRAALSERFTDRQETALRTAYLGGFFEWPRDIDGNELAEAMDISRPTYHQHLRAAQRKVFEELFE
jgi:PAS domain S-box-containing protein